MSAACCWSRSGAAGCSGVVVETAERSDVPAEKLVEPIEALEGGVPPDLVRLGLWTAEEYVSTPARGLSLVLPPGTGTGAKQRTRTRRALRAELTDAGRAALERGRAARRQAAGGARAARAADRFRRPSSGTRPCAASRRAGSSSSRLRVWSAGPRSARSGARGDVTDMTPAQAAAVRRIGAALDAGGGSLLLHGVTGSGKTEVYLRAAADALERGRSVIVLVPEIGLTPQTAARFEQRFGDLVAIMHSKLSAGERFDEWTRMRDGEARVCVGPRSAIFAPLSDVGLIVLDEEHDPSYKQEGDPRYDARRVAERRAAAGGRGPAGGKRDAAPGELRAPGADRPARARGRARPAAGRADRHARRPGPAPPAHARRARGRAPGRGEGDRPAQPARMVELPLLPGLRPRLEVPAVRRVAGAASRGGHRRLPPLRPPRARARARAPTAAPPRSPGTGSAPSGWSASSSELMAPLPVFRLDADVAQGGGDAPALRRRAGGRARGHADGGEGPRLPRRDARRGGRRRLDAALPGLPRRGAHLRAGRPARRPQRARRARRAG